MSLQGLDNEQIHSVTRIRYVVHECLRDQAGSVVTVASSSPENENHKRGRGKEKVRRKGPTGKRRRKDELDHFQEDNISSRVDLLIPNYADTGVEYIQHHHIHDPGHLLNHHHHRHHHHPCDPNDGSLDEELCHTENHDGITSTEIDDSQICISVNEVGDAQICLAESGVVTAVAPYDVDNVDGFEEHCQPSEQDTKVDVVVVPVPNISNQDEQCQLSDQDTKVEEHSQPSDEDVKVDDVISMPSIANHDEHCQPFNDDDDDDDDGGDDGDDDDDDGDDEEQGTSLIGAENGSVPCQSSEVVAHSSRESGVHGDVTQHPNNGI